MEGKSFAPLTAWTQFMAMTIAQLTGRRSLRDLISNLAVKGKTSITLAWNQQAEQRLRDSMNSSRTIYTENFFSNCLNSVRPKLLSTNLNSKEKFTSSMRQPSNSACLFFHGQPIGKPKVLLNSILILIPMTICQFPWTWQMVKRIPLNGQDLLISRQDLVSSSTVATRTINGMESSTSGTLRSLLD